jgi:hypothetical protein
MIADVMPHRDDAWQTWCTNFKTKIAMAGDGAVISFTTGDVSLSERFVSLTNLFHIAVSFGAVGSVISSAGENVAREHTGVAQRKSGPAARPRPLIHRSKTSMTY